jgi:hypothetical protein
MRSLLATACLSLFATGCLIDSRAQRDPAYAMKWDSVNRCVEQNRGNTARMQEVCGKQFSSLEISGRVLSIDSQYGGFDIRMDGIRMTLSEQSHEQTVCSVEDAAAREVLAQLAPYKNWITVRGSVSEMRGISAGDISLRTLYLSSCEILSATDIDGRPIATQPKTQ